MKIINNIAETKPTRIIATCTKDEAFRLGSNWFTKIEMSDINIRYNDKDFVNEHVIYAHKEANWASLVPCFHITSATFVYVDGTRTADEWATLSAELTTP